MEGMEGVMDAPEVEIEEGLESIDDGLEQEGAEVQEPEGEGGEGEPEGKDDPYTTKFAREMRAATREWEKNHPESAKFAKQARDNHARLFALQQVEPKGVEGVRENYALLNAIGGSEGLAGLQQRIAQSDEVDSMLASGNPKALEALPAEFNPGLAKLLPNFIDRVMQASPEAYQNALLPHLFTSLNQTPMIAELDNMANIFNAQHLTDEQKLQMVKGALGKIGQWYGTQEKRVGELKVAPAADTKPDDLTQQRTDLENQQQNFHWDTKIKPGLVQYENAKFEELFKPYQQRLKLPAETKADVLRAFKAALGEAAKGDTAYLGQMKTFRGQKNPDPNAVMSYVKNGVNKHAKNVLDALVKTRYGGFLNGRPKAAPAAAGKQQPGNGAVARAEQGFEVRTVKPPMHEIDHRNTPVDWLAQKKYLLTNGKKIQVVTR